MRPRRPVAAPAAVLAVVSALLLVPAARADQRIVAGPGQRYLTTSVTMAQGEPLTFVNQDRAGHDVTATAGGPDGRPLFATPVIGAGATAFVEGSQYLTAGSYAFYCSVHEFMQGTLTVTSDGTPAQRAPSGDSHAPGVAVRIASRGMRSVVRSGALRVSVTTDEEATVRLEASARAGGRSVAFKPKARSVRAGKRTTVTLAVGRSGRAALAGARSARVTVSVKTRDGAGNEGYGSAARTLKR
ncbi:MAG TPA: plastocyanin/azurin family copper-binding protein [Thermoleophilaceae bacterium]